MPKTRPKPPGGGAPVTCVAGCPDHPKYEPGEWNKSPYQTSTNCYAYAADSRTGHPAGDKPQPGERCGTPITAADCANVSAASRCDGMIAAPNPPPHRAGYYPVALVVDPGVDYHWYRLDDNGKWSHKPGHGTAKNVDASGNPITNPESADRDYSGSGGPNYSDFCGYFYVPAGGLPTGVP